MKKYLIPATTFTLVSLASFSIWAFGAGRWFTSTVSLYTACAAVFLVLGSLSLLPFSGNHGRKLLWLFPSAFLLFALAWCLGWFAFRNHFGEIMGSAVGILALTTLFKMTLGFQKKVIEAAAMVFFTFTLGYYLGEKIYLGTGGWVGKLGWGVGFGAGLGLGLTYLIQLPSRSSN